MDHKKLPSTPFKESALDSPKNETLINYPKSAHSKNQYRKFSDNHAFSNTPDSSVFKQFNTIVKPKSSLQKLDFSTTGQSDSQFSSFFKQRKLNQDSNQSDPNMDVEVSDFTLNIPKQEEIRKEKPSPFHEFPKSINTPKKEAMMNKVIQEELIQDDYPQPKSKQPLIDKWRGGDKLGKYKTGATPKIFKTNAPLPAYSSLTTLTRSNSDVPSTNFESKKILNQKESSLGDNKYLQNLNKNIKITPLSNSIIEEKHSPRDSRNELGSDKRCNKNLFNAFDGNNSIDESPTEHTLIPEKEETPFFTIKPPTKTSLDKILNYEHSNPNSDLSKDSDSDSQIKNENDDSFHTPPKSNPNDHMANGNLLSSTAKKEPNKGKFLSMFSNSTDVPDKGTEKKIDNFGTKKADKYKSAYSSRFSEDYNIIETLGTGNFGTVYKCQNKLDGLIYAIKCTKVKYKGTSNGQAANEAQALASLSALDENPFVVRYYNAWSEDDRLYLVMEHCQSNLNALRHQYVKFSESMIRQIMRDICMGLKHLHKQKIVHLDIKPENILYSKTKKYKIADLGMSRIASRSNGEDINEGDCRYLAPELLNDFYEHSLPDLTKADIFSFGATIYELMTGCDLPKNGHEWRSLREGDLHKIDHLSYSNSLKSIIKAMMHHSSDMRPSAHELLTNFLQSEIELELKWEKEQNAILRKKIRELEGKLKIERKKSY